MGRDQRLSVRKTSISSCLECEYCYLNRFCFQESKNCAALKYVAPSTMSRSIFLRYTWSQCIHKRWSGYSRLPSWCGSVLVQFWSTGIICMRTECIPIYEVFWTWLPGAQMISTDHTVWWLLAEKMFCIIFEALPWYITTLVVLSDIYISFRCAISILSSTCLHMSRDPVLWYLDFKGYHIL